MSNLPIQGVGLPTPVIKNRLDEIRTADIQTGPSFGKLLQEAIKNVDELQDQAGREVQSLMRGEIKDIHSAMIAVQKADVSFQMMMQVRNKLVSAYQEIMKMQV
jgi:flagellar hook-basal body complex protein FliE